MRGILGIFLAVLAACGRAAPPDVLLVTFDTTRYDRFGCTGDPEARTPTVDALAARGLLLDRAYASVGLTLPSHTTIMTGLEPFAHGVHDNGRFRVPDALETLAERLHAVGYDTAAVVSAMVLDARYRLDQGFDLYDDETRAPRGGLDFAVPTRPGAEVTDRAIGWLRGRPRDRPFFLWTHYYDAHLPRDPKPAFDAMPDRYAAEIAYDDEQLGRLLAAIAQRGGQRGLLVVFTADHGEGLGEHGERTHGILAYDSTLHVPLVLAGPGVPSGVRSDVLARHIDLVPTVLALVGVPVPRELPGRCLVAATRAGGDDGAVGYFESRGPLMELGWAAIEGVRTARWKYTVTPEPHELYDVLADAGETRNRVADESAVVVELEARRARLLGQAVPVAPAPVEPVPLDEQERLAALGYVEVPSAPAPGTAPDPRRLAGIRDMIDEARGLASAGGHARAIEMLETLRQSAAVRAFVLRTLAPIYAEQGRIDDAVAAYRDYIALTGASEAWLGLARVQLRAGRTHDTLAALEHVDPRALTTQTLRAHALARQGRHAEARAALDAAFAGRERSPAHLHQRAALVIDVAPLPDGEAELRGLLAAAPDDPMLRSWLGYYLAVWGRPEQREEAYDLLAAAARARPDDAELQANLGWGAAKVGRDAEATAALEAALALDGQRALERFRLAVVLGRTGQPERAATLARSALALRPGASWADNARSLLRQLEDGGGAS